MAVAQVKKLKTEKDDNLLRVNIFYGRKPFQDCMKRAILNRWNQESEEKEVPIRN